VCQRVIKECPALNEIIDIKGFADEKEIRFWLEEQAKKYGLRWLLAYFDDGVIWGEVREENLILSSEVVTDVSPPFRLKTLWEIRLFGPAGELLVWRDEIYPTNALRARLIKDISEKGRRNSCEVYQECYDEEFILWGTRGKEEKGGFTRMIEGSQGLVHVVPLSGLHGKHMDSHKETFHPLRLLVRHYLQDDKETGFTYIVNSRLCDLYAEEE